MQMENFDYKSMILEEMVAYIKKNAPQDKEWFLGEAYVYKTTKDGRKKVYNHLR